MSVSEPALARAERMAIDELNEGGVLGLPVEPIVVDCASDPLSFADRARALINDGVRHLFGCWTSASRKSVKDVVEAAGGLLWYPVQYEGLEQSPNVVYTGSCLNQQVAPAVEWALRQFGPRVFLVGSDYVFPRTAHTMVRSLLEATRGTSVAGEIFVPLGHQEFADVAQRIVESNASFVLNTLNGDSNLWFLRQFATTVGRRIAILSVSVAESELQSVANAPLDHYACWSYFESLTSPENRRYVAACKRRYGDDHLCSAPSVTAYYSVHLWRAAIQAAGTVEVEAVQKHLPGCNYDSPAGRIVILPNHHVALRA
jgi:urea transport system substrate-binding protein